ncbi:long-chain acyl-CoA synthetase [Scopulibacillus darangshiensis]|uniref:Long-chain acyl-CoA synthetase n=1 Tax=Scopulibacillus darangshiensis TaxID=442528 RepID=A0A4R2P9E7_9BACL|nr:AMP-binding protein [Scopulibacillus darangshiensis]TCP31527.1 long-chain acyl-CoA synthetase [Scopulibacillus darangshiensis]
MITDGIFYQAKKHPEQQAIITHQGSISYTELATTTRKIAGMVHKEHTLKSLYRPLRAGLLLPNSRTFLECFLGISHSGNICAPLDPKWTNHQLNDVIHFSMIDLLFTTDSLLKRIDLHRFKGKVIVVNSVSWMRKQNLSADSPRSSQRDFYLGYTSGTTGKPKGFLRNHESWTESFRASNDHFLISETDTVAAPGPFVHSLSLYAAIHALSMGASFYITEQFHPVKFINDITTYNISTLYVVPTMLEAILRFPDKMKNVHLSKIISSGDKLSQKTEEKITNLLPQASLFEFYGASETSFITVLDHKHKPKNAQTVGKPFNNVEISIRDRDGQEVEADEIGMLYIKSNMLFTGYDQLPEQTREIFDGDWMTAGDLAKRDSDGFIYLAGRKKNMIISGGLNVYPEEVESVIKNYPGITQTAVLGLPDPYWGEKVVALLLESESIQCTDSMLDAYSRMYLPTYKCPKCWIRLSEFPYTSSGKIAKKILKSSLMKDMIHR